jgi:hypothetical protein
MKSVTRKGWNCKRLQDSRLHCLQALPIFVTPVPSPCQQPEGVLPMPAHRKPRRESTTHRPSRRYGWIPDLPDQRDFLFSAYRPSPPALPDQTDLTPWCSTIENQGAPGSCTANALAGALGFLEIKNGARFEDFSRLFIYSYERSSERSRPAGGQCCGMESRRWPGRGSATKRNDPMSFRNFR